MVPSVQLADQILSVKTPTPLLKHICIIGIRSEEEGWSPTTPRHFLVTCASPSTPGVKLSTMFETENPD